MLRSGSIFGQSSQRDCKNSCAATLAADRPILSSACLLSRSRALSSQPLSSDFCVAMLKRGQGFALLLARRFSNLPVHLRCPIRIHIPSLSSRRCALSKNWWFSFSLSRRQLSGLRRPGGFSLLLLELCPCPCLACSLPPPSKAQLRHFPLAAILMFFFSLSSPCD